MGKEAQPKAFSTTDSKLPGLLSAVMVGRHLASPLPQLASITDNILPAPLSPLFSFL